MCFCCSLPCSLQICFPQEAGLRSWILQHQAGTLTFSQQNLGIPMFLQSNVFQEAKFNIFQIPFVLAKYTAFLFLNTIFLWLQKNKTCQQVTLQKLMKGWRTKYFREVNRETYVPSFKKVWLMTSSCKLSTSPFCCSRFDSETSSWVRI